MAAWRDGLWAELFDDPTGDGRPVSIIHVDDALFSRAIAREGFTLSNAEARGAFLGAFPDRLSVQRWLVGSERPGEALLPLLVFCCLAASEAADSDDNDYRGRMRDLMGWSDRIINCAALPRLWSKLRALTLKRVERQPTRPLILPDPRFRPQIGHAIDLTFPSRNDARRLTQELAGETFDLGAPRAVLAWLAPLVAKGRFSAIFEETFNSFRDAWLEAERTLADHRFWLGWTLATQSLRDDMVAEPFEIVSDEWGVRHLIDPATEAAMDLEAALRARTVAAGLLTAAARSHFIPLVEGEWGRLRWTGGERARSPTALLIRRRAFGSRYANLGCVSVIGAEGWGLTFDVTGALGDRGAVVDRDRLLDLTPIGCTRVDGGVLARPALPFLIETTGLISSIGLAGEVADRVVVEKINARSWRVAPIEPVDGELRIVAEPRGGGVGLERLLRLRRAILTPIFRADTPERFFDPDPALGSEWPCIKEASGTAPSLASPGAITVSPALLDVIEYLAIRTAPLPLGGVIDLLKSASGGDLINPWNVVQALRDAGIVKVLDVRGWRGRAIMSLAPRAALVQSEGEWSLVVEGCANETFVRRLAAAAERHGLALDLISGVGAWCPPTPVVRSLDVRSLQDISRAVDMEAAFLSLRLGAIKDLRIGNPVGGAPASATVRDIPLAGRHAPIMFVDTDAANVPPSWRVEAKDGARFWRARDDAILDAYLAVGERPFSSVGGRLVAIDARLPAQVARWMRLLTGMAAGPHDGAYAYAWNELIARELGGLAPALFGSARPTASTVAPHSRRWSRRAVPTPDGPRVTATWTTARSARGN